MKLKAFTLLELVVALAISAVVTGLVYASMGLFMKRYEDQKALKQQLYELHFFQTQLKTDLDNYRWVFDKGEEGILLKSPGSASMVYEFNEQFVLRHHPGREPDTFYLKLNQLDVQTSHLFERHDTNIPINELVLITTLLEEEMRFVFYKEYAAIDLMKYEEK